MILVASVEGKGLFRAKVYKHLSPVTLARIQRAVPFIGHANFFERNFTYILTPVVSGEEKSRQFFRKGSIAFMPSGSMICFFLEDTRSYKPMNPLGEIYEGFEILSTLKKGDSIKIESIGAYEAGEAATGATGT